MINWSTTTWSLVLKRHASTWPIPSVSMVVSPLLQGHPPNLSRFVSPRQWHEFRHRTRPGSLTHPLCNIVQPLLACKYLGTLEASNLQTFCLSTCKLRRFDCHVPFAKDIFWGCATRSVLRIGWWEIDGIQVVRWLCLNTSDTNDKNNKHSYLQQRDQ